MAKPGADLGGAGGEGAEGGAFVEHVGGGGGGRRVVEGEQEEGGACLYGSRPRHAQQSVQVSRSAVHGGEEWAPGGTGVGYCAASSTHSDDAFTAVSPLKAGWGPCRGGPLEDCLSHGPGAGDGGRGTG